MHFENDIFISYAHIDDQVLIEGHKGWVTNLHRALQIRLAQLLGKTPKIWRDPKLQGNDVFGDELVESLPRTALLLSVLSPRYAQSDWCLRELSEFHRAAAGGGGVRLGNKTRIFKIVKTPVPLEQQPADFRETLGYEFYVVDEETGRAHELDQAFGDEVQRQYWVKLDDLAQDIAEMLSSLEGNGAGAESAPAGEGQPGESKTVYVGKAGYDLREERDEIVRDLERRGHQVLPDQPLPLFAEGLATFVREALTRCQLAVHLAGTSYGVVPEGSLRSIFELESELALEQARTAGLERLIWMPPGLEVEDERQRAVIEHLRTDAETHERGDLLETPLEDLKTAIHDKLRPPEKPAGVADATGEEGLKSVYILCDQRDEEAVEAFADFLFDRGFEITLPVFEGDESEIRQDHEENLRVCDAAVIYYGAGNELWLRRQLRELKKSPGYGRRGPMVARGIYVAPPATPQKKRLRTREALVMVGSETFDPADLEPLLQQMRNP